MKYLIIYVMKNIFFLGILGTLLIPQQAVCDNPIIEASKELASDNMFIRSWSVLPNNDIALSLFYRDSSNRFREFDVYSRINYRGEYVIGPDSVYYRISVPSENIVFDTSGVLYMYHNPSEDSRYIIRYKYDPSIGQMDVKRFEKPGAEFGFIESVNYLPGIGNLIYNMSRKSPNTIVIDDLKTDIFQIFDFDKDKIKGFRSFVYDIVAHKLSDSKILFIGATVPLADSDGNFVVSKLVLDITTGEFESAELISHSELLSSGMLEYELPQQEKALIFEANGKLFYKVFSKTIDRSSRIHQYMFVELDNEGNFIIGNNKTSLEIEESTISNTPEKFILLMKGAQNKEDRKFWMLSLDSFPKLILDKGE